MRPNIAAKNIHGESGLDGTSLLPELSPADKVAEEKAVLAMAKAILSQQKNEVILVATGSMTNVGLLVALYPEIVEWLRAVVIMGGAVRVGNVTPVAEFNIWVFKYRTTKAYFQVGSRSCSNPIFDTGPRGEVGHGSSRPDPFGITHWGN